MKIDNNIPKYSLNLSSHEYLLKANAELIENLSRKNKCETLQATRWRQHKARLYQSSYSGSASSERYLKDSELDELKKEIEELKGFINVNSKVES